MRRKKRGTDARISPRPPARAGLGVFSGRSVFLDWRVLIATCKQLVWSIRIGRNMPIWVLLFFFHQEARWAPGQEHPPGMMKRWKRWSKTRAVTSKWARVRGFPLRVREHVPIPRLHAAILKKSKRMRKKKTDRHSRPGGLRSGSQDRGLRNTQTRSGLRFQVRGSKKNAGQVQVGGHGPRDLEGEKWKFKFHSSNCGI